MIALLLLPFLTSCSDPGVQVYQVYKEDNSKTPTSVSSIESAPSESVNTTSDLSWTDPEGWEVLPASSMVLRSYSKESPAGPLKLSISAFPGNVGGDLPNVNRWRRQLGLNPVTPDTLDSVLKQEFISGHNWKKVYLSHSGKAQLTAYTMSAGKTWFFKITGPEPAVETIHDWFHSFLSSIQTQP